MAAYTRVLYFFFIFFFGAQVMEMDLRSGKNKRRERNIVKCLFLRCLTMRLLRAGAECQILQLTKRMGLSLLNLWAGFKPGCHTAAHVSRFFCRIKDVARLALWLFGSYFYGFQCFIQSSIPVSLRRCPCLFFDFFRKVCFPASGRYRRWR